MEFRDNVLEKLNTVSETLVWIVFGDSALLNEWAISKIKEQVAKKDKLFNVLAAVPKSLVGTVIEDTTTNDAEDDSRIMSCTLDELWKKPGKNISGKWWCKTDYSTFTKKDKTNFANYLKAPNKDVMLVVTVSDFKDIMYIKKNFNRQYANSTSIHTLSLQYPSRAWLIKITKQLFSTRGIRLTEEQCNMFIMKMGSAYEEYKECIDKVSTVLGAPELFIEGTDEYMEVINKDFNAATKGIDHFEITDLLRCMTQPLSSNKVLKGSRRVHKMVAALMTSLTAKEIVIRLRYRILDMLAYRSAINQGIIPVKVPYNVAQIQEKLEENYVNSRMKKASAYAFKRNAYIASLTSIEDWFYLYSILDLPASSTEEQYLAALLSAVNRTALSNDRLMNCAHIKNTLEEGLTTLNGILYTPWWINLDVSKE